MDHRKLMTFISRHLLTFLFIAATLAITSCERSSDEVAREGESATPTVLPVLQMQPPNTIAALGIPPLRDLPPGLLPALEKMVGEQTADEAGAAAQAIVRSLIERLEFDPDATAEEAFASMGLAADRPLGIYITMDAAPAEGVTSKLGAITVLPIADRDKAEATVRTVFAEFFESPNFSDDIAAESTPGAARIAEIEGQPAAYGLRGDWLVVARDKESVVQALAQIDAPAAVRYGTAACPAYAPNEFASLIRMDRGAGMLAATLAAFTGEGTLPAFIGSQTDALEGAFSSDPLVLTLTMEDDAIALRARADLAEHEGARLALGRPQPLRLARYLPEETLGFFALRFNNQSRQFMGSVFETFFPGGDDEGSFGVMARDFFQQFLASVGDELTIGFTDIEDERPQGVAMLAVRDMAQMQALAGVIPGQLVEMYNNVAIKRVGFVDDPPYFALGRNTFFLASDGDMLKAALEDVLAEAPSGVFETFDPEIDPDQSRYAALFVKPALFETMGMKMLNIEGSEMLGQWASQIDAAQVTSNLEGTWLVSSLRLELNEAEETDSEEDAR